MILKSHSSAKSASPAGRLLELMYRTVFSTLYCLSAGHHIEQRGQTVYGEKDYKRYLPVSWLRLTSRFEDSTTRVGDPGSDAVGRF